MKKKSSDTSDHLLGISPEKLEKFRNSPKIVAIYAKQERLENGTATEEERLEHETFLKKFEETPDNLLTSEHIFRVGSKDRK